MIRQSSKNHGSHQQGYCAFCLPIDPFLEAGSSKLSWFHTASLNYNLKCKAQFKGETSVGVRGEQAQGIQYLDWYSAKVQISQYLCKGLLTTFNLAAFIRRPWEASQAGWGSGVITGQESEAALTAGCWLKMKLKPCTDSLKKNYIRLHTVLEPWTIKLDVCKAKYYNSSLLCRANQLLLALLALIDN